MQTDDSFDVSTIACGFQMSSTNGTEVTDLVPMPMVIATMALSVIGLIGNSLVVLATLISPSLRSRCNYLICILAICDVCVCIYLVSVYFVNNYLRST